MDSRDLWIVPHALVSYRRYYPRAYLRHLLAAVDDAVEIPIDAVVAMFGRDGRRPTAADRYLLHPERSGVFVLEPNQREGYHGQLALVTFLRFYQLHQHVTAARLWPGGVAPTCDASWVSEAADALAAAEEEAAAAQARAEERTEARASSGDPIVLGVGLLEATGLRPNEARAAARALIDGGAAIPGEHVLGGVLVKLVPVTRSNGCGRTRIRVLPSRTTGHR